MAKAIEISALTKDFPTGTVGTKVRAVESLDLTVDEGVVFGLLGPNGSGKSTTIKVLLGLLEPTRGEAKIFGVPSDNPAARRNVGYLPEAPYFQAFLTGREAMRYYGRLAGVDKGKLDAESEKGLRRVGLEDAADRRLGGYSKGMLQRFGLAQALIADPSLLILDEPTAGVDPSGASDIGSLIQDLKGEGKTVVLCSHLLAQVETVCDRIGILGKGRLLVEGALPELLSQEPNGAFRISEVPHEKRGELFEDIWSAGGRVDAMQSSLQDLYLRYSRSQGMQSGGEETLEG